jgi:hypothetical protein
MASGDFGPRRSDARRSADPRDPEASGDGGPRRPESRRGDDLRDPEASGDGGASRLVASGHCASRRSKPFGG